MKLLQSNERSSWKGLISFYPVFARVDFVIIYKLAGARSPSVCFLRLEKSYVNKFGMSIIFSLYKIPLGFCVFGECTPSPISELWLTKEYAKMLPAHCSKHLQKILNYQFFGGYGSVGKRGHSIGRMRKQQMARSSGRKIFGWQIC